MIYKLVAHRFDWQIIYISNSNWDTPLNKREETLISPLNARSKIFVSPLNERSKTLVPGWIYPFVYNNPLNKRELNSYFSQWIDRVKLLFRNEATHSCKAIHWVRGSQTLIPGWEVILIHVLLLVFKRFWYKENFYKKFWECVLCMCMYT
jgi:hypothetical protein